MLKHLLLIAFFLFAGTFAVFAQCSAPEARLGTLIKLGDDDGRKIPLILIHGMQGVEADGDIAVLDDYWKTFTDTVWKTDKTLPAKYALYAYQYCSDLVDVGRIAKELQVRIDETLADRNHVLLAHSMGGIVATAYMADAVHAKGKWAGKSGGDTTIGAITLGAPHHGTPGANSPDTLSKFVPLLYKLFYPRANKLYWESALGKNHPAISNSKLPNRADLRWDNYDGKLSGDNDVNTDLYRRNQLFKKHAGKLIAYAGNLGSSFSGMEMLTVLEDMLRSGGGFSKESKKRILGGANFFFTNGLSRQFQVTDGLVPFDSGLFCDAKTSAPKTAPKNFVCASPVRVRRFEPIGAAKAGAAARGELPDAKTLSIFRSAKGYDHLDMLENKDVLGFVAADLKAFK